MAQLHNATAFDAADLNGSTIAITDAALFWLVPADDYDGIVNFEISPDSGTTWFGVEAQDLTSKSKESLVSPPRAGRIYQISIPGTFRLRMSGGTQGSLSAYAELISENGTSAVTVADGADATQGDVSDAAWSGSGDGTLVALLKGLYALLRPSSTFATGEDTSVSTTPEALPSNTCREVVVQAKSTNTDRVRVGDSSGQYFSLAAGESITIPCTNTNLVYYRSATGTQGINWLARI